MGDLAGMVRRLPTHYEVLRLTLLLPKLLHFIFLALEMIRVQRRSSKSLMMNVEITSIVYQVRIRL